MTKDQLIQEGKIFNIRLDAIRKNSKVLLNLFPGNNNITSLNRKPLLVSKSKPELITALLNEAEWFLHRNEELKISFSFSSSIKFNSKEAVLTVRKEESFQSSYEDMVLLSDSEDDECVGEDDTKPEQDEGPIVAKPLVLRSPSENQQVLNARSLLHDSSLLRNYALWYYGYSTFRSGQMYEVSASFTAFLIVLSLSLYFFLRRRLFLYSFPIIVLFHSP
jgi:hypothetical protein